MPFSPDVLAANPDLAAKIRRSKSKTPGGKGHGHTPDEQSYRAAGIGKSPTRRQLVRDMARTAKAVIEWNAGKGGFSEDANVQRAIEALRRLEAI
jgi:hypothetical protein